MKAPEAVFTRTADCRRSRVTSTARGDLVMVVNDCGARRSAVEAFQTDTESLAWATAGVSVALAVAASAFRRYLRRW
jgi:hypothetical protein